MSTVPIRPEAVMPDQLDLPFWEGAARGEFLLHVCTVCERAYWPASCCLDHGAAPMEWRPSSGRGVVHTYTVFHHAYDPRFADRVPYAIAVVQLEEGPFFHTDLLDCDASDVRVDLPVEAVFETLDALDGDRDAPVVGMVHFRPATSPPGIAR